MKKNKQKLWIKMFTKSFDSFGSVESSKQFADECVRAFEDSFSDREIFELSEDQFSPNKLSKDFILDGDDSQTYSVYQQDGSDVVYITGNMDGTTLVYKLDDAELSSDKETIDIVRQGKMKLIDSYI